MENQTNEKNNKVLQVIFWILWVALLATIPFYGFTLFFEIDAVKQGNISSYFSPLIGLFVIIAQVAIFVFSFKQVKQGLAISKPYLTLLGGSILIGFIWAGGCSIMGPFRLAG